MLIASNVYFGLFDAANERNWDNHSCPPGFAAPLIVPSETTELETPGVETLALMEDWY